MPVAVSDSRVSFGLEENLDPGSSGKSLQQADCLSKLAVKIQMHLGCCVLFQKFLTISSAAVGHVALLFALGWDGTLM
eukprot:6284236-Prymnesium_polylepis.1